VGRHLLFQGQPVRYIAERRDLERRDLTNRLHNMAMRVDVPVGGWIFVRLGSTRWRLRNKITGQPIADGDANAVVNRFFQETKEQQ
jgi:hypothetical protein